MFSRCVVNSDICRGNKGYNPCKTKGERKMLLVRAQDESVINSFYVKSWGLDYDAEVKIICHLTGESEHRVLWDAEINNHPDAHDAVVRAYDDMLLFLSGDESILSETNERLRYFDINVHFTKHFRKK